MMGTPFVGSELRLARTGTGGVIYCPDENQDPRFVMEWLSNGVPLPAERQGEVLKLLPEDRGNRISFNVQTCGSDIKHHSLETPPIAASNRANGWTGRANFELLGRNADGDLVLYPRTYEPEWVRSGEFDRGIQITGSWDEPRVVGTGWNIFDIVFSPGDFDGDGYNDVLGRDSAGHLMLYPGDGDGGWQPPHQVGTGWNIFDSIVGPGDFNGDGNNDVLARDRSGNLFLYPGDGHGGWLKPSQVGSGWQIFDKIITPGETTGKGTVSIFGRDRSGYLYQYPADGQGGWKAPGVVGQGWYVMTEISGAGAYGKASSNGMAERSNLIAYGHDGDLILYFNYDLSQDPVYAAAPYGLDNLGPIGNGWDIFKNLI